MWPAKMHVIALADDMTLGHNHSSYHWVGLCFQPSVLGQLQATFHVIFMLHRLQTYKKSLISESVLYFFVKQGDDIKHLVRQI